MRHRHVLRAGAALLMAGIALITPTAASADDTVSALATAGTAATIGGYPVWAHFNNPGIEKDGVADDTIHLELERLIDAAPAGSTIQGSIYSLTLNSVAQALVDAQTRGVTVRVVLDGKNATTGATAVTTIKKLTNHRFCSYGTGNACISTSATGDMHTKMFTFSATTDPNGVNRTQVAWFGSANLTTATGPKSFNNAITVYGDAALTAGLNANFTDMWNQAHFDGNDYYDAFAPRGYFVASAASGYSSPEAEGQTDSIVTRLNDVTPDENCRLRISVAFVTAGRPELLAQILKMRAAGCQIWMVASTTDTGDIWVNSTVYNELLTAGVKIRRQYNVHDKYFALYGKFTDTYRYRIYTGSQNWTADALSGNDELFVKMAWETGTTHPLYTAYYNHFMDTYNEGTTCTIANYPCREVV
ncbi:phospholipase D-like domain-containing protein [Actinoplanes sp. NBRC 101535]|uniref:phospholipase D-like domain-containing protein n=1 Tax=Actinoplanes sp. NBRC 101535 TaxID=3032196 RepID=UPI002552A36D|nr:phospholipase D-like domain-containing protein [Actinoplanes sp. NBRC 101535]